MKIDCFNSFDSRWINVLFWILLSLSQILEKLLETKGARNGKPVNLTENEIRSLCVRSREIFLT